MQRAGRAARIGRAHNLSYHRHAVGSVGDDLVGVAGGDPALNQGGQARRHVHGRRTVARRGERGQAAARQGQVPGRGHHAGGLGDVPGVGHNLRNHPSVSVRARVADGFAMDAEAPRNQVSLRCTATGSKARNDLQITPTSSNALGDTFREFRIGCRVELPVGAGVLSLASADPEVQPMIQYHSLQDPHDRERLREAVRLAAALLRHEAFTGIIAARLAPTDQELASDAALDAWLLKTAGNAHHTSGTCKMGPASDPMAVLDQYCRVHGIQGLRVVDASIMPNVTRSNTNATTIMIAERVAAWMQ